MFTRSSSQTPVSCISTSFQTSALTLVIKLTDRSFSSPQPVCSPVFFCMVESKGVEVWSGWWKSMEQLWPPTYFTSNKHAFLFIYLFIRVFRWSWLSAYLSQSQASTSYTLEVLYIGFNCSMAACRHLGFMSQWQVIVLLMLYFRDQRVYMSEATYFAQLWRVSNLSTICYPASFT